MGEIFEQLMTYLEFPFVRYAFIVGILVSICASLLGVTLVLKRFSYIGDGLSHVAFGAMAVAAIAGLTNKMIIAMPVTIIVAILILKTKQNKMSGDSLIAMISVGALALGYLLMNIFPSSSNISADVCTSLFGSTLILTLSKTEVWICLALSILILVLFVVFYNKIFAITFDENFATATGTKTGIYNLTIAIIIAIVVVLAMNLVGSLLISALVIFPALSSMRVFNNFKSVTISSMIVSVVCAVVGLIASIIWSTPVGPTIVVVDIIIFFIFFAAGLIKRKAVQ
ncbi:metal ABC transporter permease [bacterium]|nr:metal ABC transporter permease [bacterium]